MREAAERALDPAVAAQYLFLAAEWLRLAEQPRQAQSVAGLRAEREKVAAMLASLERGGAKSGDRETQEAQRSFLKRRLFELDRQLGPSEGGEG